MANLKIDRVQLEIIIGNDEARRRMAELEGDMRKYKNEIKLMQKQGLEGTEAYIQKTKQLQTAQLEYDKIIEKIGLAGLTTKELMQRQRELNAIMKNLSPATDAFKEYEAQLKAVNTRLAELKNGSKSAAAAQTSLREKMGGIAGSFNRYGTMVLGVIASLTGLIFSARKAVDAFNELESAAANLKSITGQSDAEVQKFSKTAREWAISTVEGNIRITKSAEEIVDAFTSVGSKRPELLKNGEALRSVTKDALILSQTSKKMNLDLAVDATTASMNQFNLAADQSRRIINAYAAGSLAGSAEVDNLTASMKNVGTVAADSNLSLEQTIAALEVLGEKQLYGEEAGTKLRGALLKLKEAGVGYTSGQFNMRDALEEVNARVEKHTAQVDKDAIKIKMFGAENVTVGTILLQNIEKYDQLTEAVTGTNTAMEQAAINTDTNAAKLEQAKNRAQENAMVLGEKLAPALTHSTNAFNYLVKALILMIKYGEPVGRVFDFFKTTILTLVNSVGELLITLGFLKKDSTDMTQIMRAMAVGFQIILAPTEAFLWILTGIVKAIKWTVESFSNLVSSIKNLAPESKALAAAIEIIKVALMFILGPIGAAIAGLNYLRKIWNSFASDAKSIVIKPAIDFSAIQKAKEEADAKYKKSIEDIAAFEADADEKKKQLTAEEKEQRKKAYQDRLDDEKRLKEQIIQWNLEELADGRTKAEKELKIWYDKEKEKIKVSKASAKTKNDAVASLNLLFYKKQEELEAKYNADLIKELERQKNFLIENNAKIAKSRTEMMDDDIAAIEAKYNKEIEKARLNAETDSKLKEQFLQVEADLEKAKTDAVNAYKLKAEEEYAKQVLSIREQYGLLSNEDYYQQEIDKLDAFYLAKLISDEDYAEAKKQIDRNYQNAKIQDLAKSIEREKQITEGYFSLVSSLQEMELSAAGDNEEKKKAIKKKYADIDMVITISKIAADTALAVAKLFTELPWWAAIAASVGVIANGAVQTGKAVQARNEIKQLAKGKYPVIGEDDGKTYHAEYAPRLETGIITRPTLVAEEPEMVVDNRTLYNAKQDRYGMTVMDHARSIMAIKYGRVPQRAEGYYTAITGSQPEISATTAISNEKLDAILNELQTLRYDINNWNTDLKAHVVLSEIEKKDKLLKKALNLATLGVSSTVIS